jgi:5,6-dimethylbenzimidazole synthase
MKMFDGQRSPIPQFDGEFKNQFENLIRWRRDVRRFRPDPVPEEDLRYLLGVATLSPSVGNSQPWRFVRVETSERRVAVQSHFEACNTEARKAYDEERATTYARLKLAGLREAPVHIAVFSDTGATAGHGLGRRTMPETLAYSVVGAIHTFWLAARARGIGVGWVSIVEPGTVARILEVPGTWQFIAYLCVGYPQEEHLDPELERHGWQSRLDVTSMIIKR